MSLATLYSMFLVTPDVCHPHTIFWVCFCCMPFGRCDVTAHDRCRCWHDTLMMHNISLYSISTASLCHLFMSLHTSAKFCFPPASLLNTVAYNTD